MDAIVTVQVAWITHLFRMLHTAETLSYDKVMPQPANFMFFIASFMNL